MNKSWRYRQHPGPLPEWKADWIAHIPDNFKGSEHRYQTLFEQILSICLYFHKDFVYERVEILKVLYEELESDSERAMMASIVTALIRGNYDYIFGRDQVRIREYAWTMLLLCMVLKLPDSNLCIESFHDRWNSLDKDVRHWKEMAANITPSPYAKEWWALNRGRKLHEFTGW